METLPIELLASVLPSSPEDLGSVRLICRSWKELVSQGVVTIQVPVGKALRYSFLTLFPSCSRVLGLVDLPEDGDRVPALTRILQLRNAGIAIQTLDLAVVSMTNSHLKVGTDCNTFHFRSPAGIVYAVYERGRLSIEIASRMSTPETHLDPELTGTSLCEKMFADVPIEDVFLDFLVDTGERVTRSKCPAHNVLFPFFFRKKPQTLRFKGPQGERLWASLIKHADWPLRIIRLQAYPPSLGVREPREIPLLDEEGYVGIPEPPLHLMLGTCSLVTIDYYPTVTEYQGPIETPTPEEFRSLFPRLQTLYRVRNRKGPEPVIEGLRIVHLQFTTEDRENWRVEARARKGLPPLPVCPPLSPPPFRPLSLHSPPHYPPLPFPTIMPFRHLETEDPLDVLREIRSEGEAEKRGIVTALQEQLLEKIQGVPTWPLILPLETVNDGAIREFMNRLERYGLSCHRMLYIQDVRGPRHSFYLEYRSLNAEPPRYWWRDHKHELHIFRT